MNRLLFVTLTLVQGLISTAQEVCNNGVDDDGDGLVDLNDSIQCRCSSDTVELVGYLPNPSFEYSATPPLNFVVNPLLEWTVDDWSPVSWTTPDYYRVGAWMPPGVPTPIPDGSSCVGAVAQRLVQFEPTDYFQFEENIGSCLIEPLPAGCANVLTFWVASKPLASDGSTFTDPYYGPIELTVYGAPECGSWYMDNTDLMFDTCLTAHPEFSNWSALGSVEYIPAPTWSRVHIPINASFNVGAIMFATPCPVPDDHLMLLSGAYAYQPYYFFDGLSLSRAPPIIGVNGQLCSRDLSLTVEGGGCSNGHQWYLNGVALVGQDNVTLGVSELGLASGEYTVVIDGGDGTCISARTAVTPPPVDSSLFTVEPRDGCEPLEINVVAMDSLALTQCVWSFGDGTEGQGYSLRHIYNATGTFDVSLHAEDTAECLVDTMLAAVVVYPAPVAGIATYDNEANVFQPSIQFYDSSSGDVVSWLWSWTTSNSTSYSTSPDPEFGLAHVVAGDHTIHLVVGNEHGCLDTTLATFSIRGSPSFFLPNAFTPNGDGIDELFGVDARDLDPSGFRLLLFDRWGQVLFETADPEGGWDGTVNGEDVPIGVYAWRLQARSIDSTERFVRYGHVTLVR